MLLSSLGARGYVGKTLESLRKVVIEVEDTIKKGNSKYAKNIPFLQDDANIPFSATDFSLGGYQYSQSAGAYIAQFGKIQNNEAGAIVQNPFNPFFESRSISVLDAPGYFQDRNIAFLCLLDWIHIIRP